MLLNTLYLHIVVTSEVCIPHKLIKQMDFHPGSSVVDSEMFDSLHLHGLLFSNHTEPEQIIIHQELFLNASPLSE